MEVTIQLRGLHCDACTKISSRRIKKIEGVTEVRVDKDGTAIITTNRQIDKQEIREALKDTEYSVV